MNLEDMSTKDLERLYYKHFDGKAFREEGGFKTDNPNKVGDDVAREMSQEGDIVELDVNTPAHTRVHFPRRRARIAEVRDDEVFPYTVVPEAQVDNENPYRVTKTEVRGIKDVRGYYLKRLQNGQ